MTETPNTGELDPVRATHSDLRFRAAVLLADVAQVEQSGKIGILGAGWHVTTGLLTPEGTVQVPPQSVVIIVEVPATRTAEFFHVVVDLLDDDGRVVSATQMGQPQVPLVFHFDQQVRAEPTPYVPRGFHSVSRLVLNFAVGLAVPGYGVYRWQATIDNQVDDAWSVGFAVTSPSGPTPPVVAAPPLTT